MNSDIFSKLHSHLEQFFGKQNFININGIAQHVIKEDPLHIESADEQRHIQQQQHRYQRSLIKIPNQQNQQIGQQPVKCSMFTQTEQTNSFTQTEQSNSSYSDQRQVI